MCLFVCGVLMCGVGVCMCGVGVHVCGVGMCVQEVFMHTCVKSCA